MRIPRPARAGALLGLAALLAACAPAQTDTPGSGADEMEGTLRVWLFSEVDQEPKEQVVDEAVAEFEADHEGVTVDVQYIPIDTRAERFQGAFNDPSSAPDVAEYGNTDLAGYVEAGGFADIGAELAEWEDHGDISDDVAATAQVDGGTYGVPWFLGVRALYYRTDVFDDLGIDIPETLEEVVEAGRAVREDDPDMLGISTGGAYTYGFLPFVWANGGDIAEADGESHTAAIDSEDAKAGLELYAEILSEDVCPPQTCAQMTGNESVQNFIAGEAAMTIGGNFNLNAVQDSDVAEDTAVVPLPGAEPDSIAPAFAGGNNLGVLAGTDHRTLSVEFVKLLSGKKYQQQMYEAMGNLPTLSSVQSDVAATDEEVAPFIETLDAGTRFVPVTGAWAGIDAEGVLPTMVQRVATGDASVDQAAQEAAASLDDAFTGE
ncbi:N,N'-diacetylchitobiose transport system substrate-binding protein [Spinactinospora alkalitolerans]|uniref:N,N'-diacetylchitobiose transport system substrate-binding protein n=1 Tax=Spinactinospora alkalitolerans TaxID=687207 RepID=A0A852TXW7_9ACTN|nr:extracellular solute-binding protein [Spinactinospora alkalitolerans]NYE47802.1 N,N'-diacetylchitobiose transport system substrate-binding protein [Spinactinospora alkalitolerans]